MEMRTVGPFDGEISALRDGLKEAQRELGTPPKLAVVYLPIDWNHDSILREIQQELPCPLVGATTGGAAFTERGVARNHGVGAILGGDDVQFDVAVATGLSSDASGSLKSAMDKLPHRSGRRGYLMVLADAFACDGEVLVAGICEHTLPHLRLFGGTAGDGWTFNGTFIFAEGKVLSDAAALVLIRTDRSVGLDVLHGWNPIEGGRCFEVTEVDGNVVRKLANRPAAEVYREELERLGLYDGGDGLMSAMAKFELGTVTPFREGLKVRAPLRVNDDGSVVLASGVRLGEEVRVVSASEDQLIAAAKKLAYNTRKGGARPLGSLVFDCAARLQLLGPRYDEQRRAFCGDGKYPVLGMACYGEIAKFGGSIDGFHNTTAVMLSMS